MGGMGAVVYRAPEIAPSIDRDQGVGRLIIGHAEEQVVATAGLDDGRSGEREPTPCWLKGTISRATIKI